MTTEEAHKQSALTSLRLHLQPDVPPTLDSVELGALLEENRLATIWQASAAYRLGAVVLPATPNGHRYKCIRAGTSAASEPAWPEAQNARVADGTALWQDAGPDYVNIYDVRAAIHAGCKVKMSKASALFNTDDSMRDVFVNYQELAKSFKSLRVA